MLDGIVFDCILVHSENAQCAIDSKLIQLKKAKDSIEVVLTSILIDDKELHPSYKCSSMIVTLNGNVIDFKFSHFSNALYPIDSTFAET